MFNRDSELGLSDPRTLTQGTMSGCGAVCLALGRVSGCGACVWLWVSVYPELFSLGFLDMQTLLGWAPSSTVGTKLNQISVIPLTGLVSCCTSVSCRQDTAVRRTEFVLRFSFGSAQSALL